MMAEESGTYEIRAFALTRPKQLLLFQQSDGIPLDETDKYQLAMQRLIDEGWPIAEIVRLGKMLADPRKWTPNVLAIVRGEEA
jgi:hypothetical protein